MSTLTSGHRRQDEEPELKRSKPDTAFDRAVTSADMVPLPYVSRIDTLRRTIESDIIPRLMLASRASQPPATAVDVGTGRVLDSDVLEFTHLLLDGTPTEVATFVERMIDRSVSQTVITLDLFAKSARRLGEMWETDTRNFAEVTLAMGALRQALRVLKGEDDAQDTPHDPQTRKILLTPGAGEQHSFPVLILDAFFTRGGWQVETRLAYDAAWMEAFIKKHHVHVVGLSISREGLMDKLASDIENVRRRSCNRSVIVLVGGHVFIGRPELVSQVGADGTANDARSAVELAGRLVPCMGHARP